MVSSLLLQLKLLAAHFRRHRKRTLLTLLAIVIGVASVTGILTLNRSAYGSFESAVAGVAGRANFEIANGAVGVPVNCWRESAKPRASRRRPASCRSTCAFPSSKAGG
jgi:hypothetical protein